MNNHQLLDNIIHKNLRIKTQHNLSLEPSTSYARVFLNEFRDVQNHYPILFYKPEGADAFEPIALFGFAARENLFLDDNGWHARYVPLSIQRKPFLIGFQTQQKNDELVDEPMVFVDMDSPRVSRADDINATPVFLPEGGPTDYISYINSVLIAIHEGHGLQSEFVETLQNLSLLERLSIKAELKDGTKHEINSFFGIHEEKLKQLSGETLHQLQQKGYLQAIYMCIASISNIRELVTLKNKRQG